jgi:hypothetical protein
MTDSDDAATDEPFLIVIRSESCAARTVLAAGGGCYLVDRHAWSSLWAWR